ncbi:dihydrolipoamide acetyltransferase family protein [Ammoniphilus sp. CFH 90114]|uniref:dihydrolipoamide acetyltransferase family protein n=1 Tax=Ammoniphilus sp. CFH 90114 TaxID=2493665 RepID=UPI00101008A8|nr:dihydrolipoamide acetyltransferase family protein [Ammoniphilus sp. CFH 90114]RXT13817.1 2-oxo acid dehydrogenase subunit E2 [Ammoniphilus sp. CFH 90114]
MAEQVLMPQLGESVTEGTISKWLVKVGDRVNKYEALCEVNTDKVNAEVPSTLSGIITQIVIPEGDTVAVGTLICYISTNGEEAIEKTDEKVKTDPHTTARVGSEESMKQRYSPAVLKLAQDHHIDLGRIQGTGAGGRITRKDVQAVIDQGGGQQDLDVKSIANEPALSPQVESAVITKKASDAMLREGDEVLPLTGVRRTIATRMVQSKHDAPHAWTMIECDVTNLVKWRNEVKDDFKKREGFNLTFLPFFIKAVVESIKEFPIMNAAWGGDKIIIKKAINISIAVATDDALYVPVLRDADQKSIYGLAKAIDELARKTRAGKLTIEDMAGGTFTCNNTGSFGSVLSAPIINQPQAAILSMESIVKRPAVIDESMIAIRDMVNLCLSLDHRILDGLVCGRFLQSVKTKLEAYGPGTKIY